MDNSSDSSYHSESEFYYGDECENDINTGNIGCSEQTEDDAELCQIQEFIEKQRPESTKKKTEYDMNIWRRYCSTVNEKREPEIIPAKELNVLLCKFFMNIKKQNGQMYEPSSLTSVHRSLQRHLNDKNSPLNLFKDQEFSKSREVLKAKKRELVEQHAKGNRPQAARELTEAEEDLLFQTRQLGDHDPETLQRTVWWVLSLHFGFRARDESRKLKWGDVVLDKDPETGREIQVWTAERGSKTRHGDGQHQRAFRPTAQATNNERCPVRLYKAFARHRPKAMKKPDSPFYLAVNQRRKQGSDIWYMNSPLGKNLIGKFLVKAANAAGFTGNINHSVRKTCISRLMDAKVPETYVAQLSGHRNLKSLDAYKSASNTQQREMSMVLSRSAGSAIIRASESSTEVATTAAEQSIRDKKSAIAGIFLGANIGKIEGCTFNFGVSATEGQDKVSMPPKKRRRAVILSDDSDSD